jgi:hypothetical protein
MADPFIDVPLAEETPPKSQLHHAAARSVGRSRRLVIQGNDAYKVFRWGYEMFISQAV